MNASPVKSGHIKQLAARAAMSLREGSLTLRNILELTEQEMQALAQIAESYRFRGNFSDAMSIYGVLISYDPLKAQYWRAMADLQYRSGQHALAVACDEVGALLGGRDEGSVNRQIRCLEQLRQHPLAQELLQLCQTRGREVTQQQPSVAEALIPTHRLHSGGRYVRT